MKRAAPLQFMLYADTGETEMKDRSKSKAEHQAPRPDNADQPMLDAKIQDVLGRAFRAYSADIIHEPIPEKFLQLLAQLDAKERRDG
ncbi:MAG: hypothetical protein EPO23_07350 [Xanthobacteraceae bacterium]|nr:MAG: hypothetical protein EPO23_07350 [Xanthobacteraceae bacterium]